MKFRNQAPQLCLVDWLKNWKQTIGWKTDGPPKTPLLFCSCKQANCGCHWIPYFLGGSVQCDKLWISIESKLYCCTL